MAARVLRRRPAAASAAIKRCALCAGACYVQQMDAACPSRQTKKLMALLIHMLVR
jgi:hypothetical protein